MFGKKISRFHRKFMGLRIASLIGNIVLAVVFFVFALTLAGEEKNIAELLENIFANGVAISIVLVEIVLILVGQITSRVDENLEESEKITDNHHAVIDLYNDYKPMADGEKYTNYFSEVGSLLTLKDHAQKDINAKNLYKEFKSIVDASKDEKKTALKNIEKYANSTNRVLELPDLNVFTNIEGNVSIKFDDHLLDYHLPNFIESNAIEIMKAHKTSKSKNEQTIRLDGYAYDNDSKTLTMKTRRTCYNHMLLTNRCMDYMIGDKLSVRQIYEYRSHVMPLDMTRLGNQIGVEGLIITKDGYTLIEKRPNSARTTWRDKFAQPISLSMKKADVGLKGKDTLGGDYKAAEEAIRKMLKKHLLSFGLRMKSIDSDEDEWDYDFDLSKNFLGISRDLLEGGKPNIYFYVVVKGDHEWLLNRLKTAALKANGTVKDKDIDREYYLYPLNEIEIDYNYVLPMKMNSAKRVFRRRESYSSALEAVKASLKEKYYDSRNENIGDSKKIYRKECGESFLGCLSYFEICKNRIEEDYMRK